jgi:hypothetical protein
MFRCIALTASVLGATAATAAAQQTERSPAVLALRPKPTWVAASDTTQPTQRPSWLPPLSSLLIPGSGQLMLGQERGAIYLVLEALFITQALSSSSEGSRESDRYRELAFTVARAPFGPVLRDTAFEYYEKLTDFIESGPFDTDPGPDLVPPTDERTFNGAQWALARETFFVDPDNPPPTDSPEYQRALRFYEQRAVGPNFLWTWRNAGLEQDLYRQTIRGSDEAFRRATTWLGLLLANHLVSAVDAFITTRLAKNGSRVRVESALEGTGAGRSPVWRVGLSLDF